MTPEARYKRDMRWRHFGHIGSARLIETQGRNIAQSPTASPRAKELATQIAGLAEKLRIELATSPKLIKLPPEATPTDISTPPF